ncbi:hypothetical protein L7F22_064867 [Adiantum nelumboides]|nr:hypothetical protein [Adiantum nelumboides]
MHGLALFVAAVAALAIAQRVVPRLPIGLPRLVFILPIFFLLPWTIPIYHLRAILSFIFLWTVPSKLLLLCWDAGIDYPSSGFLYFATIVMMPIRVKGRKSDMQAPRSTHGSRFWWQFIAVIAILNIYSYRNGLPLWAIYVLYTCHMYLGLELMLGGLAKLATACFGVEYDPQFNNPFMCASLSEFWGRRWNLVVTTILRSTIYNPALRLLMRAEKHKAHQSRVQEHSSTEETTPHSLTPKPHEHMPIDADVKQHQDDINISTENAEMENEHDAAEIRSSILGDAEPLASKPILKVQEIPVLASSSPPSHNVTNIDAKHAMEKHGIHPSGNSEVNSGKPVEGTQHTYPPTGNTADDIRSNTEIPNGDKSHEDAYKYGDSQSESKRCSSKSFEGHPANDGSLECKRDTTEPDLPLSCNGARKPTLRARLAVAMLTRASTRKNLHSFIKADSIDAERDPADVSKIKAEGKGVVGNGDKPSLRARAVAMLVTFAVSGLVHELIFYYINKSKVTGEVTAFFILHGCTTAIEVFYVPCMYQRRLWYAIPVTPQSRSIFAETNNETLADPTIPSQEDVREDAHEIDKNQPFPTSNHSEEEDDEGNNDDSTGEDSEGV